MTTEPSLVGDIEKMNDLTLLSHDKNVITGSLHLANNNNNGKKLMNNLTRSPLQKLNFTERNSKPWINSIFLNLVIFTFFLFFFNQSLISQNTGDYRSVASGNWTILSTWQSYNGTSWVAATSYPGQNSGTNDVSIEGGYSVTITSNIPNYFNSLNVGDGIGATDTFFVGGNSSLILTSINLANGGYMSWTGNNINLDIPTGSIFIIEAGGSMDVSAPCNATKTLTIGSSTFASCVGGSSPYSFQNLMDAGGNVSFIDTDGDGILNGSDIDDDNDGITDEDEGVCAVNNGDVELPLLSDGSITWSASYNGGNIKTTLDSNVPFWTTTASDSMIEIWSSSNTITTPHANANTGTQFMELNANQVASSYQDILTIPNSTVSWTVAHRGRSGTDNATVSIGAPGSVAVVQAMSTSTAWVVYTGTYLVPAGQTITRFQFDAVGGGSSGNFLDSFILSCPSIDTDDDGVPNYLDLDSDNDGIYDIDESGVLNNGATDSNKDGIIDGSSFGANGLFNSIESDDTITATITYTIAESSDDSDIIPNFTDLDSDGDGIPDNVEAQTTTGYTAPVGIDTDNNGVDDAYDSNGTPLTLTNSDGIDNLDYLDTNSDNDGGNDTTEAGLTLSGTDSDSDGLDDAIDADTTGYSDPGGTIDDPLSGSVILPDIDGDAASGGDVDFRDVYLVSDLSLIVAVNNLTACVGDVVIFTITVTNSGPDDLPIGAEVTDLLPTGYTYVSDNGGGSYISGTGVWSLPAITNVSSNSLEITATVNATGVYNNIAEITISPSDDLDSTPNNGVTTEDDYDSVLLTVNALPTAPTGSAAQSFCSIDNPTVADLTATGTSIQWYAAATGGVALAAGTALVDGTNYYASQTVGGCESDTRFLVVVTVNSLPTAEAGPTKNLDCNITTVSLDGTGSTVGGVTYLWTGGTIVSGATTLAPVVSAAGTYTLTVTNSTTGCFSSDTVVVNFIPDTTAPVADLATLTDVTAQCEVTALTAPTATDNCGGLVTVTNNATLPITAQGTTTVTWTYEDAQGNTSTQTQDVVITYPVAPTSGGDITECEISPIQTITATANAPAGSSVVWFDASINGNIVTPTLNTAGTITYYAESVDNVLGCSSSTRTSVTLTINPLPIINNVVGTDPTTASCPILNDGTIVITTTGSNLEYSIDNGLNFQASNIFNGLIAGSYDIIVRNTATTCSLAFVTPVVLTAPGCIADLVVTKTQTGGANPVIAIGQTLDYTITLENSGTLDITNVVITDILPDGSNGALLGPVGDNGILGIIDVGETWTYTISYTSSQLDFTNAVDLINEVSVTSTEIATPEVDTAITPLVVSDLSLTKTVNNASPLVGSNVVFTLTVNNDGPSDATGIDITDILPNGYTYLSDDSSGAYNPGSGIWAVGGILNGNNATLNITGIVNASGNYTNTAEITVSDNLDTDSTVNNNDASEDDQDSITTSPIASSDLSLNKTVDNSTPNVGDNVIFTLTVNNNGPSDATGVEVNDLLPNGYTYISDDASGAYISGTGIWTVPTILNGNSATLNITTSVNSSGNYVNIAEVTGSDNFDSDSTPGNGNLGEDDMDSITPTPVAVSDMELTMTVNNPTPLVGDDVIFTITVDNNGPSDATGIVITDLLPSGYAYVSDDGAGAYVSGTGIWSIANMTVGNSITLNITATVNTTGAYTNISEVTAADNQDPDSTPGNNVLAEDDQDEVTINPTPVSDIELTKTVDNTTPVVSSNVVFTILVTNNGPSDATGITVTDLLPTGYTFVSDDSAGSYNNGTGIWTIGTINSGNIATLNITANVNAIGDYTNIAEVTSADNFDPDSTPGNNNTTEDDMDSVITTPAASSDLSIVKTIDNLTPNVGSTVVFTLALTNSGASDLPIGTQVMDLLPAGYTYLSDNGAGAYNDVTGLWNVSAIANGSTNTLQITATVNPIGNYTNIAEITVSPNFDPDSTPGNGIGTEDDMDSVTAVPVAVSDIELTKTVDNGTPLVGSNVIFTITVVNNGPSEATGIEVLDLLPTGYAFVSDDGAGAYASGTGLWTIPSVSNGNTATLNITASVDATGNYNNIAEITAADNLDLDSTPGNGDINEDDQDEISTTPIAVSDVELLLSVDNTTPLVETNVIFTITVMNNGPSEATGIVVTDLIPNGFTYVSDDSTGEYVSGTGLWTISPIASGSSATLNITAFVHVTGDYTNIAEITAADNFDPDSTPSNGVSTEDDQDEITLSPIAVSDIGLTKIVDNSTPYVGTEVVFTITVTNNGPSDATGVEVSDLLENGFVYVSDDASGNYNSGTGVWNIGNIVKGNTVELNITASVLATGTYNNTAEVIASDNLDLDSTPGNDVLSEDDQEEVVLTPIPVADLSLVKTVSDLNPTTGDIIIFTLTVHNDGPSGATGVAVEDVVPDGYGNITPITNGSNLTGNTITWLGLTIANGADVQLQFSTVVLTTGTYFNSAEIIDSGEVDLDSAPNSSFDNDDLADGITDDDESILDSIIINFLPTAFDDNLIVVENTIDNELMVLNDNGNGADDFGGDGPSLSPIVLTTLPTNGTATVNDNGTPTNPTDDFVDYTPNADFVGIDSFTYTIEDGQGLIGSPAGDTSTATVNIEVLVDTDGDLVGDIYDIDDDNDGILDTVEGSINSDSDSYQNSLDIDSDNDGIPDNIEAQTTSGYIIPSNMDTDRNGLDDAYESSPGTGEGLNIEDTDGDTTPDYIDDDSDSDSVMDSLEGHDANHDSLPDVLLTGMDNDEDGLDDGYEGANIDDGFIANDEITDPITDLPNADLDNEVDYRDEDDDNDGILTYEEDINGDNDPTNDNSDGDFVMNYLDIDDDNDGILTSEEGLNDFDNDGYANYLDLDADGDGLPDNIEAQDTDTYVLPSYIDSNTNGLDDLYESGSIPEQGLEVADTDNDGDPDYLDLDTDNDNVPDHIEGHDFNHDGVEDIAESGNDQDMDGLDDAFEGSDTNNGFIPNGNIFNPRVDIPDTDGTEDVDYRDVDDDGDGIDTIEEDSNLDNDPTNDDCDEDFTPNYLDVTSCSIVPNGFSPNGDGVNDTLIVPALSEYLQFEMEIFTRWGNKVYHFKRNGEASPDWWNGRAMEGGLKLGNDVLPVGTYFYSIKFNQDDRKPETGWIYLNK